MGHRLDLDAGKTAARDQWEHAAAGWDRHTPVIREWLRRSSGGRSVKVTIDGDVIELTGASDEMQQQLIDTFVRRHAGADV